jgi:hypothetical protein
MKISLFIDIVVRVKVLGAASIGGNGLITILKSRKIRLILPWISKAFFT